MKVPGHTVSTEPAAGRVRVLLGDQLVADSSRAVALHETHFPVRFYVPREDVQAELLPSDTHTVCPFKGRASYHAVKLPDGAVREDLAWYYPHPLPAVGDVSDMLSFAGDGVEIQVDGESVPV